MTRRWRGWILRTDEHLRQQIDDELQAHLEARIEHLVARGVPIDEARRQAVRRFGDFERARAALQATAVSRRRRVTLVERASDVLRDGRYVLRTLRRAPAFTLGVVGTFALGLGLNTAVFRVADQALIRPPAGVRDAAAIRRVETLPSAGMRSPLRASLFSFPDADAVAASGAFQSVALQGPPRLMAGADGRDISVSSIDDRFFALLGVPVRAGRGSLAVAGCGYADRMSSSESFHNKSPPPLVTSPTRLALLVKTSAATSAGYVR